MESCFKYIVYTKTWITTNCSINKVCVGMAVQLHANSFSPTHGAHTAVNIFWFVSKQFWKPAKCQQNCKFRKVSLFVQKVSLFSKLFLFFRNCFSFFETFPKNFGGSKKRSPEKCGESAESFSFFETVSLFSKLFLSFFETCFAVCAPWAGGERLEQNCTAWHTHT